MRVRLMTPTGDMQFGRGSADFSVNSPVAVAQLVMVRLRLWVGQWFLDTSAGVPWLTKVLGTGTKPLYDSVIRAAISLTPGVVGITSYSSSASGRALAVSVTVTTLYSSSLVNQALTGTATADNGSVQFTVNY